MMLSHDPCCALGPLRGVAAMPLSDPISTPDGSYILSAGDDRHIRLWDLAAPQASGALGHPAQTDVKNRDTLSYSHQILRGAVGDVRHIIERRIPSTSGGPDGWCGGLHFSGEGEGNAGGPLSMGARGALAPPSPQHQDSVSCMAVLRFPVGGDGSRVLSAGLDGVIKVWA